MNTTRLIILLGLTFFAQGALANTIWLKDRQGSVCINTGSGNAGGVIGLGGINIDGSSFFLKIDNPKATKPTTGDCANLPTTDTSGPLVFNGTMTANVVPIAMMKPGTKGVNECLNQGNDLSGITGAATIGAGATLKSLQFNFSGATGCMPNTYQAPFVRGVILVSGSAATFGGAKTIFQGNYYIFNPSAIPEPGTIPLLLAGLVGLGYLAMRRRTGATQ
jgi:hypothetical protein